MACYVNKGIWLNVHFTHIKLVQISTDIFFSCKSTLVGFIIAICVVNVKW